MEKEKSICFSLKRVNHIVERGIHTSLAAAGFEKSPTCMGGFWAFCITRSDSLPKGYRIKFWNCRSTVTNIMQLMEKKGYLTRTNDEHDARLKRLELTELGKKVHLDTIAVIDSAHDTMEAGITDEERRICFEVLGKICKNVEKITGGE